MTARHSCPRAAAAGWPPRVPVRSILAVMAGLAAGLAIPLPGHAQAAEVAQIVPDEHAPRVPDARGRPSRTIAHRVVIQVTQNDPAAMNLVLNNVENLTKYYRDKHETVQIEVVAYGPGIAMFRSDISPVRDRLSVMGLENRSLVFSVCGNTLEKQSKAENKTLTVVPEARIVPAGIARVVELQESGWSYVRP